MLSLAVLLLGTALTFVPTVSAVDSTSCNFSGDYGVCYIVCDPGVTIHVTASDPVSGHYPRTHVTGCGVNDWCQGHMGCSKDIGPTSSVAFCYSETISNSGSCSTPSSNCNFTGDYGTCTLPCSSGVNMHLSASDPVNGHYPRTHVIGCGVNDWCQGHMGCSKDITTLNNRGGARCFSETISNAGSCAAGGGAPPPCGNPTASLSPGSQGGPAPFPASFTLGGSAASGCSLSSYSLDFGDSTSPQSGSGAPPGSAGHSYGTPGTYTARLTVTQNDNKQASASGTVTVTAPPAPNDNFANAPLITYFPYTQSQSNAGFTTQTGEPLPCGAMGKTAWFKLAPDATFSVTADTIDGSTNFDTVLAVHRGTSLTALTLVGCNDDFSGIQSRVAFTATVGQTYYIQVGGFSSASGNFALHVNGALAQNPPSAPQNPFVSDVGPGKLQLQWGIPASNGGAPVQYYKIYAGTTTPSTYLGRTTGTEQSFTEVNLLPGPRVYAVTAVNAAGEGPASSSASGTAYWLYTAEVKAFIPHAKVVDPDFYTHMGSDSHDYEVVKIYDGGRVCHQPSFVPVPGGSTTEGSYRGDDHTTYDGNGGSYRARSIMTFRWDGSTINHDTYPGTMFDMFGETERLRRYTNTLGQDETCVIQHARQDHNVYRGLLDSHTFNVAYETPHPIQFGAPDIDAWVHGSFDASGVLTLTYDSDEFPSNTFRVTLDDGRGPRAQLTVFSSDVSCLSPSQVMGGTGMTKIGWGLTHWQGQTQYTLYPSDPNRTLTRASALC